MISPCLGFMALVLFCKFIYNIVIYRVSKGTYNLQNILIFGYVLDENSVKLIFLYFCFRSIDSLPILSFLLKKKSPDSIPLHVFQMHINLKCHGGHCIVFTLLGWNLPLHGLFSKRISATEFPYYMIRYNTP